MKPHKISLIISVILIFICFMLSIWVERGSLLPGARPTLGLSDEALDGLSDILFFFPAGENPSLSTDIYTTVFEEDNSMQYLIVSRDFDTSGAVCYSVDPFGQYWGRHIIKFDKSGEYIIGCRTIIVTYTDLPVLSISIADGSPSIEELNASDKSIECHGDIVLSFSKETARKNGWPQEIRSRNHKSSPAGTVNITGRGNVSWYHSPKKSYTLAFRTSTYIPGLGRNRKWNLISNSQDKSLLNNEVFYRLADEIGVEYEPSCMQSTVYINGIYSGVYMLTSRISVDPDRIALGRGDFLMNFGDPDMSHAIFYNSKLWLDDEETAKPYANIKWPKNYSDDTVAGQTRIIQRFIDAVEDPSDNCYTDYLDLKSAVRYYWVQEISMNYDADYRSAYAYYRSSTDKIYLGPVWDMDIALGWNADKFNTDFTTPQGWKIRNMSSYACLFDHEDFAGAVRNAYWNEGIREAMFDALEYYKLRYSEMAADGRLNYRRWRSDWPGLSLYFGENYEDECTGRIAFFTERAEWIDEEMSGDLLSDNPGTIYSSD